MGAAGTGREKNFGKRYMTSCHLESQVLILYLVLAL
jgi:hypothetical protein